MKKLFKIFVATAAFLSVSCSEDWLTLQPKTQVLESDFYKTEADITQALVSAYDVLQWGGYGGYTQFEMLSDILSDDALCGGGDANDQPPLQSLENFTMTPSMSPDGLWGKWFSGINRANIVITRVDGVQAPDAVKARIKAEAYFLRAFYNYNLWRVYGSIPKIDHLLSPEEYSYPQSTPDEIYAYILNDLDNNVIGKLPATVPAVELGRLTNGAAIALKAKLVLYKNDNAKMGEIASQLKTLIGTGAYALEADLNFVFSNSGEFCAESVFEVNHTSTTNWGDWGWLAGGEGNIQVVMTGIRDYTGTEYYTGWGFSPVSKDLYDAYETGDLRRDATIINAETMGAGYKPGYQNTGYFAKKYAPRPENTSTVNQMINFNNNIRIIRFSDVLLMAAEAILRSGGAVADAQTYFDMVRDRAFGNTANRKTLVAGAAGLDLIYAERRFEFALEGVRYWDLVRTDKAQTVLGGKGWTKGKHEYFPIAQTEIDKTSGDGKLKQNAGY